MSSLRVLGYNHNIRSAILTAALILLLIICVIQVVLSLGGIGWCEFYLESTTRHGDSLEWELQENKWEPMSIMELTGVNKPPPSCTYPFVPVSNIIAEGDPYQEENGPRRKIPRYIHFVWVSAHKEVERSRPGKCLHYLQAETLQKWHQRFPNYSIFFHDDDAVDTLMEQKNWPEFPELSNIMQCAQMRGAMLADVYRVLVTYKYGGLYIDLDLWPKPDFTPDIIPAEVDYFSFSDGYNRPSQNTFGVAPGHPAGYFAMQEILSRILKMKDISNTALVTTTGPDPFKIGYGKVFNWKFEVGTFPGLYNTTAKKLGRSDGAIGVQSNVKEIAVVEATHNTTYHQKIKADTGVLHWVKEKAILKERKEIQGMSCREYLYKLERDKMRIPRGDVPP